MAIDVKDKSETLPLTPAQIEGPYFRLAAPQRSSLIEPGMTDPKITITGRVLNPQGKPIPGAIVNFWSSDGEGNYDMVGYKLHGYVVTDSAGRYSMETIVPACYEPRQARHIHVKVQGVSRPMTTQLYFSDDEPREKDNWYKKELEIEVVGKAPNGGTLGKFDFVIGQITEKENVSRDSLKATVQ